MSTDARIRQLQTIDLFADCSPAQLRRVASLSAVADLAAGRVLCRRGELGREFFVILDGSATVTIDGSSVAILEKGCGFGEIALLTPRGRRTATVSATTPMTVLVFERREFAELIDAVPTVARRVLQASTRRLAAIADEHGRVTACS